MIDASAIAVADAVMYEGLYLYPYRKSSLKNRYRWTFGTLPPRDAPAPTAGGAELTAACLLRGQAHAAVDVLLRFLIDDGDSLRLREIRGRSSFGADRTDFAFDVIAGTVVLERSVLGDGYERIRVGVQNRTGCGVDRSDTREAVRARSLHGVHILLCVGPAAHFVSLADPPSEAEPYAAHCESRGLWCTVMGRNRARPDTVLAAPVILPDFPRVAPESCANLCDATEIDEMLALRIRTLSDAEKREGRADSWVRAMFDRVEALNGEQLLRLHGTRREPDNSGFSDVRGFVGARVILKPCRSADAIDMLLSGRVAIVRRVERSVDGEVLLGVTLEDDPGSDFGVQGLPGHRFFFGVDEVSLLDHDGAGGS